MPRRRLIIMRHAKSDWGSGVRGDFDRPLNERGKRDAPRVGRWLREQGLVPDLIISSPSVRTRATATAVAAELGTGAEAIVWEAGIYEASLSQLREVLRRTAAGVAVPMLVGHNPGLEQLLRHLTRAETLPAEHKLMPTGAVYVLEFPASGPGGDFEASSAVCIGHIRPRWLE
jgi:phosphohistidine phosphatase